jgi:hypothetical protein
MQAIFFNRQTEDGFDSHEKSPSFHLDKAAGDNIYLLNNVKYIFKDVFGKK